MVTPWIGSDYEPDKKIVKNFLPYANQFNTILFSEYNPAEPKKYDFPTGIGKNLLGILLSEFKFEKTIKIKKITKNYLLKMLQFLRLPKKLARLFIVILA